MLARHAIGGGVSRGPGQQAAVMPGSFHPEDTGPHAVPCVGCGTVALHPCLDVLFAIMPVRPGREAIEGCDEHVLVQAVFTEYELGGCRSRRAARG